MPRAERRFATFTQAIRSTKPTAPSSISMARRTAGPTTVCSRGTSVTLQPVFDSGNVCAIRSAMPSISVRACSNVTVSARRPNTVRVRPPWSARARSIVSGSHTSVSGFARPNPFGITPTIVVGRSLIVTTRPMTVGAPPKWRSHMPWPMTAIAGAPGASSPWTNTRP